MKITLPSPVIVFPIALAFSLWIFSYVLNSDGSAEFHELIAGYLAFTGSSKFQDLIALPILALSFVLVSVGLTEFTNSQSKSISNEYAINLNNQLLYWWLPAIVCFAGYFLRGSFDPGFAAYAALGSVFLILISSFKRVSDKFSPIDLSILALSAVFLGLFPQVANLLAARVFDSDLNSISNETLQSYSFYLTLATAGAIAIILFIKPQHIVVRLFLPFGQLTILFWYSALFSVEMVQPGGDKYQYPTSPLLAVIMVVVLAAGFIDIVRRFVKSDSTFTNQISPICIFALYIALTNGSTASPIISPDDYHFGEKLVGWWSYLRGAVPYVDLFPPHGVLTDDLAGFISHIIFDGTAGTMNESTRLATILIAGLAFFAFYWLSGNIFLSFLVITLIGGSLTWLALIPFACLWFKPNLLVNPLAWIVTWVVSSFILVFLVPAQGMIAVAAAVPLAFFKFWILLKQGGFREFRLLLLIGGGVLGLLLLVPNAFAIYLSIIEFVLDNGSVNQESYGLPWKLGFTSAQIPFELIRNGWVLVLIFCGITIYHQFKVKGLGEGVFLLLFAALFVLMLVPYSMGRIDPGALSRMGIVSAFSCLVLFPLMAISIFDKQFQYIICLVVGVIGGGLNLAHLSLNYPTAAALQTGLPVPPLADGAKIGMPNVGVAYLYPESAVRLSSLNAVLESRLQTDETYIDLTSRSAQYFYLNRMPIGPTPAPYNMPSISQQTEYVDRLQNPSSPDLALLSGANINFEGGGLPLRNNKIFRYMVKNFDPVYELGFILGERVTAEQNLTVRIGAKELTDENWIDGVNRVSAAVVFDDPFIARFLSVGERVFFKDGSFRVVEEVRGDQHSVWFGNQELLNSPGPMFITLDIKSYLRHKAALYSDAFPLPHLEFAAVSWGRSFHELGGAIDFVGSLKRIDPNNGLTIADNNGARVVENSKTIYDVSSLGLSGEEAGLLKLDVECARSLSGEQLTVSWMSSVSEFDQVLRLRMDEGTLIIPLDISPYWLLSEEIHQISIESTGLIGCGVPKASLYQRVL